MMNIHKHAHTHHSHTQNTHKYFYGQKHTNMRFIFREYLGGPGIVGNFADELILLLNSFICYINSCTLVIKSLRHRVEQTVLKNSTLIAKYKLF